MAVKFKFETLDQAVEIEWPVKVNQPIAGGKFEEASFTARFKILPVAEIQAIEAKAAKEGNAQVAVLREVLIGLGKDEGELTEPLKERLLARDDTRTGLLKAYGELVQGAMAKN